MKRRYVGTIVEGRAHYIIDDADPRYEALLGACGLRKDGSSFAGGCWLRDAGATEEPEYGEEDIARLLSFAGRLKERREKAKEGVE